MEMTNINISIMLLSHYSNSAPQIKHKSSGKKYTCSNSLPLLLTSAELTQSLPAFLMSYILHPISLQSLTQHSMTSYFLPAAW